jgi:hypothetical protein
VHGRCGARRAAQLMLLEHAIESSQGRQFDTQAQQF